MGQARTICLAGHSGCGKTTLALALMKRAGVKDQISLDASQEEKERGCTIDMGIGAFQVDGASITLLDTPGGDEFLEEMYKAIPVADLTFLVVGAEKAVEVGTERVWEVASGGKYPTAILVNHMDKENADFDAAVDALRDHFEAKLLPIQIPIGSGPTFVGIVDLVANRPNYFSDKGKKDVAPDISEAAESQRAALVEEIATVDDELMMKFLDEKPISDAELAAALAKGVSSGQIVPILCACATQEKGIDQLLKSLTTLTGPAAGNPAAPCRAVVFNVANDPYLGRLAFVRVLDGTLHEGKPLVDTVTGGKADIRDLYALEGTKQKRVSSATVGEVVAIAKADGVVLCATLAVSQDAASFKFPQFPRPGFSRTIVPKTQADVEKMSAALKEVAATKKTIEVERDPVTKELTLHGMGDVHLHVIIERLKNRYNVALETRQPRIPYK